MTELKEVFEMTTQQIEPDLDAWRDQERLQQQHAARRKRSALLLTAALTVAATVIVVTVMHDISGSGTRPASQNTTSPTAEIGLVGGPSGIIEAGGSIWVSTYSGLVYRIDASTNQIVDTIDIGQPAACGDLVEAGGSLWVSGCAHWGPPESGTVQIDLSTGEVVGTWPPSSDSPVFGGGRAWAFDGGAADREVHEVDPATGRVIQGLDPKYRFALGYAFDSLWLLAGDSEIVRLDPDTGAEIASYQLPSDMTAFTIHGKIGGFASAGGYVWLTAYRGDPYGPHVTDGALYRIDPASNDIEQMLLIKLDPTMSSDSLGPELYLDSSSGVVWVAETPDTVVGLDAETGEIVGTYPAPGDGATNVEATADALWVTSFGDGTVWRYDLPPTS